MAVGVTILLIFLVLYGVVCFVLYRSTRTAREETKRLNAKIIQEGQKAEGEYEALATILINAGHDMLDQPLIDRANKLFQAKVSKDRLEREGKEKK